MAVQITETFYPKTRSDWRKWLEKNHKKAKEIWVVYYKKAAGKETIAYNEAVEEALCFGWIDGIEKSLDSERYTQRFSPRAKRSNWSQSNIERYKRLLHDGLMTPAGTEAFNLKFKVYTPAKMSEAAMKWHKEYRLPKNPTLAQRIAWHKEHKDNCGCRPIPKSLQKYFV